MHVLGRWNWWAPKPLARLHDRFGITEGLSEEGGPVEPAGESEQRDERAIRESVTHFG
jgi:RND superfamily putative drug exporter